MSAKAVMHDGRELIYPRAETIAIEGGSFAFRTRDQTALIARFPFESVERVEFESPIVRRESGRPLNEILATLVRVDRRLRMAGVSLHRKKTCIRIDKVENS